MTARRPSWLIPAVILAGLFAFYLAMFPVYRPYDIDNPWFLSFSYNFCTEHIDSDQFMNMRFPYGSDGTQFFGKLAAYTQCAVLSHTGWQQWPAVILCSSLVVFALGLWWLQLRKLGFGTPFITCFLIATGLSEPFLATADKFRFEFLSFALSSLGILLVVYGKPFLGIFFAALAVETGPAAMAGIIPCLVFVSSTRRVDRALITRLIAGVTLAVAVYLGLHPGIIHVATYIAHAKTTNIREDGGSFVSYFLDRPRHLPELLCFLVAGGLYWYHRRSFQSHYLGISALLMMLFSMALPHGNPAYVVYCYPFFIAVALVAFHANRRPWIIVGCVLLYIVPQQAYLVYVNRDLALRSSDIESVSQAIQNASATLHLPDPNLRIYGDYRLWFAHPHFYRAAAGNTLDSIQGADLYLCYEKPPQSLLLEPHSALYCPDLRRLLSLQLIDSVPVRNNLLYLYARRYTRTNDE